MFKWGPSHKIRWLITSKSSRSSKYRIEAMAILHLVTVHPSSSSSTRGENQTIASSRSNQILKRFCNSWRRISSTMNSVANRSLLNFVQFVQSHTIMTNQTQTHLGYSYQRSSSTASDAISRVHSVILKLYWASQISSKRTKILRPMNLNVIINIQKSLSGKNTINSSQNLPASMLRPSRHTMSSKQKSWWTIWDMVFIQTL